MSHLQCNALAFVVAITLVASVQRSYALHAPEDFRMNRNMTKVNTRSSPDGLCVLDLVLAAGFGDYDKYELYDWPLLVCNGDSQSSCYLPSDHSFPTCREDCGGTGREFDKSLNFTDDKKAENILAFVILTESKHFPNGQERNFRFMRKKPGKDGKPEVIGISDGITIDPKKHCRRFQKSSTTCDTGLIAAVNILAFVAVGALLLAFVTFKRCRGKGAPARPSSSPLRNGIRPRFEKQESVNETYNGET